MMSDSSTVVKQATHNPKFKSSKQADDGTGSKETAKIHFE
jgi:hypothetical protein